MKRKEGTYFQALTLPSHFWLPLLPFCFKRFLLAPSSQVKEKKKKTIEKKKNAEKGRSFPLSSCFALSLCALVFALLLIPFCFKQFLLASSFFQVEERKKTKKKKPQKRKKNAEKGGSLPFFFHFCIWDEALLLLSPLHIPSMLSSPPSSSLMSHVSSKLCATQARELSQALEME